MSLEMLDTMSFWAFVTCIIGSLGFGLRKIFYVKGTRGRYVAATLEVAFDIGVIISLIVIAGVQAAQQDLPYAAVMAALALWRLWWLLKGFDDDDHWFNDQWKRLKRGFKKLRQNLANASPLPSPSSA